ncbi:23S rRNA pseudouridine2605 synthase [Persephonella hydrogeniphila]|uniref:Pseudouridine synthase n=1 Tax=Persephonella hydrogeniphila TaxID=198703 RepID=A0A285NI50_9AQUI|nr:pseudouridine synthase [Persephonella hydrogeniphila]SNZ08938.1 23S rRNA pseudouridine2605 synthase [Persephonella hydrogeniphila]
MLRLNRFIAQSGYCSRRKADELIFTGKVKVNGEVIKEPGTKVNPEKDIVEVEGKKIKLPDKKLYIKLYKPRGYLTQLGRDKFGRKTLTDLFEEIGIKERVFPAGRLDYESEGLLILTNDGDFANLIMHPSKKIRKTYIVEVKGRVRSDTFRRMVKGVKLEDGFVRPDDIKILRKKKDSTVLQITIHTGQKRVVRRFMKTLKHPVLKLIRTKIGKISVDGMKSGEWKYITEKEIKDTRKLANLNKG